MRRRSSGAIANCTSIRDKLNVHGGAIALGHPIGCTGARITTTWLHALRAHNKTVGLATLCISGGMGLSMLVERV